MSFEFNSSQRIRESKCFKDAFRTKGALNQWFIINTVNTQHGFARLGMVITKRIIPHSVYRNIAKRLIRETFRIHASNLPPLDFVVRIRRNLTKESSNEARTALLQLMLSIKPK